MAVCSGMGGLMIEYDKRKMRPYGYREPPKPIPLDEQIRLMREKWPVQTPTYPPPSQAILLATCQHFGVNRMQLMQRRRLPKTVYKRHLAMYLLREMTTHSYPDIGRLLGGWDHTSVLHAGRLMEQRIAAGNEKVIADVAAVRALAVTINPTLGDEI